jgi:hypothetical protein
LELVRVKANQWLERCGGKLKCSVIRSPTQGRPWPALV